MKKLTAFVLSAMMVLSLAACGAKTETPADTSTPAADATKPAEVAKLTYAVEAGSAGEEVALANGYNVVSVDSQAKALMEVQAGTADADHTKHAQRHRHRNDDHQADVERQRQIKQRHRTAHGKHSRLHCIAQLDRTAENRAGVHKILRDKVDIPLFA